MSNVLSEFILNFDKNKEFSESVIKDFLEFLSIRYDIMTENDGEHNE